MFPGRLEEQISESELARIFPTLFLGRGVGIMVQNKLKLSLLTDGCLLRTAPRNVMRLSQADARQSSSVDRWISSEDCSAEFSAPGSRLPYERLSTWDRPFNCWWDPFPKKKKVRWAKLAPKLTPVGKIGANGQNRSAKSQPVGNNGRQNWGQRA